MSGLIENSWHLISASVLFIEFGIILHIFLFSYCLSLLGCKFYKHGSGEGGTLCCSLLHTPNLVQCWYVTVAQCMFAEWLLNEIYGSMHLILRNTWEEASRRKRQFLILHLIPGSRDGTVRSWHHGLILTCLKTLSRGHLPISLTHSNC